MRPYIENAYNNNQYRLMCQYNGTSAEELENLILGNYIVGYELPKVQTLESAWDFRLYLASGETLAFSSKCTGVGGWDEIGSLSIKLKNNANDVSPDVFVKTSIEAFNVINYSLLIYEEGDVYSESGICFTDSTGAQLMIVAAPAPGAVSVNIPGIDTEFKPEFSISDYKLKQP